MALLHQPTLIDGELREVLIDFFRYAQVQIHVASVIIPDQLDQPCV